ncbi:unnamed protein product [Dibothriocephalus latus]|uniref:Uncharacterized protein n=1 Tax=Dibothriocephalus latus TaxID=60516 RepID=A0A3P6R001_DIBLA|nr:unnamed protein product [Dibothriocephalus latus]
MSGEVDKTSPRSPENSNASGTKRQRRPTGEIDSGPLMSSDQLTDKLSPTSVAAAAIKSPEPKRKTSVAVSPHPFCLDEFLQHQFVSYEAG